MHADEKKYNRQVAIDRVIHYLVIMGTFALILFSFWYAYNSSQVQKQKIEFEKQEVKSSMENKGKAKPLPDFIIDKMPSDELEQLKP